MLLEQRCWDQALDHMVQARECLEALTTLGPAIAEASWPAYGRLVNALTAAIHPVVTHISTDPPPPAERARLCWRLQQLLAEHHTLPVETPAWLGVLEGQLIQDGAIYWRELIGRESEAAERALELFHRLEERLDPCPQWVRQALGGLGGSPPSIAAAPPTIQTLELELVYRPGEPLRLPAPQRLGLNLAAAAEDARQVIREFFSDCNSVPQGETLVAVHPRVSLWRSLEVLALLGESPPLQQSRGFCAAVAAWKEQALAREAMTVLPFQAPQLPTDPVELLIELEPTELAVLQCVAFDRDSLMPALDHLQHESANLSFWGEGERRRQWWNGEVAPLDILRRFYREQGFYAQREQPARSLEAWSERALSLLVEGLLLGDGAFWSAEEASHWLAYPVFEAIMKKSGRLPPLHQAPSPERLLEALAGQHVLYIGAAAEAVEEQVACGHAQRLLLDGEIAPYSLVSLPAPESRYPLRPHGGFEDSLDHCLKAVERLQGRGGATVAVIGAGAYRLPLVQELRQRYGLRCLGMASGANQLFGVELPGDPPWWPQRRDKRHWRRLSHAG